MNTFLANISLVLSALISAVLFTPSFRLKPAGGNDEGATGYMMILIAVILLAFLFFMGKVAWDIVQAGGFDWISQNAFVRNLIVGVGLFCAVVTLFLCSISQISNTTPDRVLKWAAFGYYAIPVILIVLGFVLLNGSLRAVVPAAIYKLPLMLLFGTSILSTSVSLFALVRVQRQSAMEHHAHIRALEDESYQINLKFIDTCDIKKDFTSLLTFTHKDRHPELREKALTKIKSQPDWQQYLVFWLENHGAIEVLTFLKDNEVPDKKRLAEPVKRGVFSIADYIRQKISYKTHPSHAHPHEFTSEVNLILSTINKFEGLGTDYLPAVKAVRAALDEPCKAGKLTFDCVSDLDEWIKQH